MATPAGAPPPPDGGHVSIWVGPPGRTPLWALGEHQAHDAASTWKLVVLIAWLRAVEEGLLDPATTVHVHADFGSAAGGGTFEVSRDEDDDQAPWNTTTAELGWLVERMVTRSSNLATDLVLEHLGLETVSRLGRRFTGVDIRRPIDDRPAAAAGLRNTVTAAGLAQILTALWRRDLLSDISTDAALRLLRANTWNDEIPALLPTGTFVAHKNGWDLGIRHDAGIITSPGEQPLIVSVLTSGLTDDVAQPYIAEVAAWGWQWHVTASP